MEKGWVRAALFILIVFILTYVSDFAVYLAIKAPGAPGSNALVGTYLRVYLPLRMFMPLLSVLISLGVTGGFMTGLRMYGFSLRGVKAWHILAALGIPFAAVGFGLTYGYLIGAPVQNPVDFMVAHGLIGSKVSEGGLLAIMIAQTILAGLTINAFFAFGEEMGWRGLLQSELTSKLGSYVAAPTVGVIWGLWHAPLIVLFGYEYPLHRGVLGVSAFTLFTVIWGCILYEVRSWSGSVLPPAILHGTMNAVASLSIMALPVPDTLIGVPVGLLGMLGAATVLALMLAVKTLRKAGGVDSIEGAGKGSREVHEGS